MERDSAQTTAAQPPWERNLYALTVASFLMFTAFGFVFPFLPLFIAQLGVGDEQHVEVWSRVSSFAQALVLSIWAFLTAGFCLRPTR
jgi:hypothetical protein